MASISTSCPSYPSMDISNSVLAAPATPDARTTPHTGQIAAVICHHVDSRPYDVARRRADRHEDKR